MGTRFSVVASRGWLQALRTSLGILVAFGLASCGGGGGGDSSASGAAGVVPIVAAQPRSQTVADAQPATFTVGATGSATLTYQWFRGSQSIAGANQASYTLAAAQLSDSGSSFSVTIANGSGSATSAAAVLTVRAIAPTIADDQSRTVGVLQGSSATFSVTVSGSSPLTFQWQRNGVDIAGATTSTYTTPPTTPADNGARFVVVVTNAAGTVTSAPFTLAVTATVQAPTIAAQPQSATVRAGGTVTFGVTAGGTAPFTYQWLRNGQAIAGAQASTYTVASAQTSDNGAAFSVVVTNGAGATTSAGAILTVIPLPGIAVIAGNIGGPGTIDGMGQVARFAAPSSVAIDNGGNLYVADGIDVRKVTSAGVVNLYAGSPTQTGSADGAAAAATFQSLAGVAVDASGNVFVADVGAFTIRRIDASGVVTTFAGTAGASGSADGTGSAAQFSAPRGLAVDASGNLYVADGNVVRKITSSGTVTTLAGTQGSPGSSDGIGAAASFQAVSGIALDGAGNLYVTDTGNHTVRLVTPAGVVSTLAGSPNAGGSSDGIGATATFDQPTGIAVDGGGTVYVSDVAGTVIRKIAAGAVVTTVAGTAGAGGYADGTGAAARFGYPSGLASDASGTLYVADRNNTDIRQVSTGGVVTTFAGLPAIAGNVDGTGSGAQFNLPFSIAIDGAGNLYVGDYNNGAIRKVTQAGAVTTLAGGSGQSSAPVDGVGRGATFLTIQGLAVDPSGNVYVADRNARTIRKVTPGGVVTTLAGTSGVVGSADGTGAAASFGSPTAIAFDARDGNLYVTDAANFTVRRVTIAGVVTTLAGTAGQSGSADGTGTAASFSLAQGIVADANGDLYVSDAVNSTIRKVTLAGVVTTIAGTAGQSGSADGIGAAARFGLPFGIVVDASGNLYVVDTTAPTIVINADGSARTVSGSHTIRKIDTAGRVTTVAGVADRVGGVKVGALPGHFNTLTVVTIDAQGNLYGPDANGVLRITLQ